MLPAGRAMIKISKSKPQKPKIKGIFGQRRLDLSIFPEKDKVWRANELCEAKLEMNTNQLSNKIFCALIANLDPNSFPEASINAKILTRQEGLKGDLYERIYNSTDFLSRARITKVFFNKKSGKEVGFSFDNIFQSLKFDNGKIYGKFNDEMGPLLLGLKEQFTVLDLNTILAFESYYSLRMYEILSASRYKGEIEYELTILHEILAFPIKLRNNFNQFKTKVLEQSKIDIEAITDLKFNYYPIKANRSKKIVAIKFVFGDKAGDKLYNKYDTNYILKDDSVVGQLWQLNPSNLLIPFMNILKTYSNSTKTIKKIALAAIKAKFDLNKFIEHITAQYHSQQRSYKTTLNAYIIGSCQIKLGLKTPPELRRS